MNTVARNVLAVILGAVVGGLVNMGIVLLGPLIIPPPEGMDMSSAESMSASIELLQPQHFLSPFLAHALGTLSGVVIAYLLAASRKQLCAYGIGCLFLAGGIAATFMIPAPLWFVMVDLLLAYIPMAWLGIVISKRISTSSASAEQ